MREQTSLDVFLFAQSVVVCAEVCSGGYQIGFRDEDQACMRKVEPNIEAYKDESRCGVLG